VQAAQEEMGEPMEAERACSPHPIGKGNQEARGVKLLQ